MGSYIINFTVYTLAMLGLIFFALYVYKKVMNGGLGGNSSKFLHIEETMNINPRKALLVVRAGNEKFLIASDADKTTLISKLDSKTPHNNIEKSSNFNRFKNINLVVNEESFEKELPTHSEEQVHLEPIKGMNQAAANLRRGMDNRSLESNLRVKNSTNKRQSIQELAKRINNL